MSEVKTGYCNGSDMLLYLSGKAVGHCSTHSTELSSDLKDRAVKPVASAGLKAGMWKSTSVTGLSISISAEGINNYDEAESGYKILFAAWKAGKSIEVKCMERANSDKPYLAGLFAIESLKRDDPAREDSTYSVSLKNDGEPTTLDETAITVNTTTVAP